MITYSVCSLDVWGHGSDECCAAYDCPCVDDDGEHDECKCECNFTVNDSFHCGEIEVSDNATDDEILAALDDGGFVHASMCEIEDFSDGTFLYVVAKSNGRPLLNLIPMIRTYTIRFVHKITTRESDVHDRTVRIPDVTRDNRKEIGSALRCVGALLKGQRVASCRVESDGRIVAFPEASIWHAIILTPEES